MRIYIAGKITGLPFDEAQAKFNDAKEQLKNWGYEPVSPLDNECVSECWCEQMMACLPMLLSCTGIHLLTNWTDSEGAKIELTFAMKKGMYVIEQQKQP